MATENEAPSQQLIISMKPVTFAFEATPLITAFGALPEQKSSSASDLGADRGEELHATRERERLAIVSNRGDLKTG